MLDKKTKLKLIDFWIDNPDKKRAIPDNLKGKISREDAMNFQRPYRTKTGKLENKGILQLKRDVLSENNNQTIWNKIKKIGLLIGIIAGIATLISIII